jgi:hypothetical protein
MLQLGFEMFRHGSLDVPDGALQLLPRFLELTHDFNGLSDRLDGPVKHPADTDKGKRCRDGRQCRVKGDPAKGGMENFNQDGCPKQYTLQSNSEHNEKWRGEQSPSPFQGRKSTHSSERQQRNPQEQIP